MCRFPGWAGSVVPMDGAGGGGSGPSAADSVNLSSGVYENTPGADIAARNPYGPDAVYARSFHSGRAAQNYNSPGLARGWIDNYDFVIQGDTAAGCLG